MKGDFVEKFINEIGFALGELGRGWSQISYKGFRYSDFGGHNYKNRKSYNGFKNLEQRGVILHKNKDSFIFTNKGKQWARTSYLKYLRNKHIIWDKKWRIVIFDIPTDLHKARNRLRYKLKSLGFVMLQKSVFAFPHPCEEELGDLCSYLKVGDYVDLIIAESIGFREKELREFFKLS